MTAAVGSAAGMAPEVYRVHSFLYSPNIQGDIYDMKADVYSFSIVCWELCHPTIDIYEGFPNPTYYASMVAIQV